VELLEALDVPVVVVGLDGAIREANHAAATLYEELGSWIVDCSLERGTWRGRVELSGAPFDVRATVLGDAVIVAFFSASGGTAGENLRATIDSLSARVAVVNERGVIVAVNASWREFAESNGAQSDFVGVNYLEVCDAAGEERVARQLRELLNAERESIELEYPCDERWFAIRGMPYASDGQRWAIVIHLDITDRRSAQDQLQLARDYLRAVIDGIGHGMYTLDEQGCVRYMNQAAQDLLGWPIEEVRGRDLHEIAHHHRPDGTPFPREQCPILRTRERGELVRIEQDMFVRADGTHMPVAYTAAPIAPGFASEGTVVVFEDISERQAQTLKMEHDLEQLATIRRIRGALADDGFLLYAQPIIDLASGEAVQRELLIRMRDPDGEGVLAPGTFLPAAEEYGFIADIDRWVIARSAEIAAAGRAVELNISAASLGDPDLIEFIAEAMERTGADPTKMVFEITETTLVSDQTSAREFVTALHELGCKVALDDFGTGYGGFTYLKQLPIDYLKIDIEFVRDLAHSMASRKVVEVIVNLAHGFELKTVAEGVEDEPTLALLRTLGVDYAQGYHLGRPAPLEV
jgi:PAS domain S-box-containing protein